jgi:predicted DNA-binding transcriptional regulator AlpA
METNNHEVTMDKRIIRYAQLKPELGIPYSRVHIDRLESEGKWPKRFKLSEGGAFVGWWRHEIVEHLSKIAAQREGAA